MAVLIPFLIALNLMLGTALIVAKMRQMDQRHAQQVRAEQEYKSHFRGNGRD